MKIVIVNVVLAKSMMVIFIIFIGITIYFVYYNCSLIKNNAFCIKFNTHKETKFSECNI